MTRLLKTPRFALALLLALTLLSPLARADGMGAMSMGDSGPAPAGGLLEPEQAGAGLDGPVHLMVSVFPLQSAVPRTATFIVQARYANGTLAPHTTFEARLVQTEDEHLAFATTLHAHDGQASFAYGFNDGAEHRLEVRAHDTANSPVHFQPVEQGYLLGIEPQEPSPQLQLRVMASLMLFFAGGALAGRGWGIQAHGRKA